MDFFWQGPVNKTRGIYLKLCDMQNLDRKLLFTMMILALVASLFQSAFAYSSDETLVDSYSEVSQAYSGSVQHPNHQRCTTGASAFHCATSPSCSISSNGFSLLPDQTVLGLFLFTSKASHTRENPSLYIIYPNLPLRPPITLPL
jgi:hypothetical protein